MRSCSVNAAITAPLEGAGPTTVFRIHGRLYQRRKVDTVQPLTHTPGLRRRSVIRDARCHHPQNVHPWPVDRSCFSDTVGFIRDLPHTLVAAFQATLEETVQADLLLHVVDAGSPNRAEQIDEVNKVLKEIGADRIPQILVLDQKNTSRSIYPVGRAGYQRDGSGRNSTNSG